MMFGIGIALFALAILASVALHECGHMWVARATGMKVRRYFVGFGPTLWSTRRPNKLGDTEYGVKAIPLGGFCDIAGMTSVEELAPDESKYAMYKQKTWKRVAVLFAGPGMNFVIGLVILYVIAFTWGLPNLHAPTTAIIGQTACVAPEVTKGELGDCTGPGPAAQAGLQSGDTVVKVGDTPVTNFEEMAAAIRKLDGPTAIVYERDGQQRSHRRRRHRRRNGSSSPTRVQTGEAGSPTTVGAIGVSAADPPGPTQYNPLSAVPATFAFTGDLAVEIGKSLVKIPTKIGALGALDRRRRTRPGDADQRRRRHHHRRRHRRPRAVGGVLVLPGPVELRPRRDQPGAAAAVRRRPHRDRRVREDPQHVPSARGMVAAAPVNYLKLMPITYVVVVLRGGATCC